MRFNTFRQLRKSQYVKLISLLLIIMGLSLMFPHKHAMAGDDNKKGIILENVTPGATLRATLDKKKSGPLMLIADQRQEVNLRVVGSDGESLEKITGDIPFRIEIEYNEKPDNPPTSSVLSWTSINPEFPSGTKNIPVSLIEAKPKTYQSALYFLGSLSSRDSRDVRGFRGNSQASPGIAAELFAGKWTINHSGGEIGSGQGVAVVSDDGKNVSLSIGKDEYESFEIMATRDSVNGRHTLDVRFKRKDKDGSAESPSANLSSPIVPRDASGMSLTQPTKGSDKLIPNLPDSPLVANDVPDKKPELNYQVIFIADGTKAITAKAEGKTVEVAVELPEAPPENFRVSLMTRESGMSGGWSEELTNGDLTSAGQQRWVRGTTKVEGIVIVGNQLDASGGYNYPYKSDGSKIKHLRTTRTLVVYGSNLPKFSDGTVIKSLSDAIGYQTDPRSANDRELVIEKAFKKAKVENFDQYDAFIVTATLAKGIKPGMKTLSVNGENLSWPLLFANQTAVMRFVRSGDTATGVFYPGDTAYVRLSFRADIPYEEIPILISTGRLSNPLEHGVLLARRVVIDYKDGEDGVLDDDPVFNNYVTEPIHLYHRSNAALSPPDDANALRIPVLEGAEINARLVDSAEALALPPVVRAKIRANPDQLGTLWKETLDRVAACTNETIVDYDKFQRKKGVVVSKLILTELGRRKISLQKGDQAAAILIRDQFIKSTMESISEVEKRAKNIEFIRAFRERAKSSEALADTPFWRSFEATYIKAEADLMKKIKVPLAETLNEDAMAKKFNISKTAAKKWAEEQTMRASLRQVESMQNSVSWAQDAGDCKMDKLLLIAGHRSPEIVGRILPRLVKQKNDAGPPQRQYWVTDEPAQAFVKGLYITGEAVRALDAYSEADTNVALAVAALATLGTTAALEGFGYAGAALWTMLAADTVEIAYGVLGVKKYIDGENYYDFAKGANPALGEGVFNDAYGKRQSAVMTAVGVLLPTGGGMSTVSRLRHFKNVRHGKALFKTDDVLNKLSTLKDADRVGLAGYYTDMLAKVRKSGIGKLDDADRAAFDAFQGYFKGKGVKPPGIAQPITKITKAMNDDPYHPDWKRYVGNEPRAVGADVAKPFDSGDFAHDLTTPEGNKALDRRLDRMAEERGHQPYPDDGAGFPRGTDLYDRPGFKHLNKDPRTLGAKTEKFTPSEIAGIEARSKAKTHIANGGGGGSRPKPTIDYKGGQKNTPKTSVWDEPTTILRPDIDVTDPVLDATTQILPPTRKADTNPAASKFDPVASEPLPKSSQTSNPPKSGQQQRSVVEEFVLSTPSRKVLRDQGYLPIAKKETWVGIIDKRNGKIIDGPYRSDVKSHKDMIKPEYADAFTVSRGAGKDEIHIGGSGTYGELSPQAKKHLEALIRLMD